MVNRPDPSSQDSPSRSDQRGIALVLTLLIISLLTTLIVEYDFRTRLDARTAANFRDDTSAYLLADSVVQAVRGVLQKDYSERAKRPYDSLNEEWATPMPPNYPVGDGTVSVIVEDETGKLDLNRLVADPNLTGGNKSAQVQLAGELSKVLERLLVESLEMDPVDAVSAIQSVQDWIDVDDIERTDGAESNFYSTLDRPYEARNGPLRTIDELALIHGFDNKLLARLTPHVTAIWEGPDKTPTTERGKININTASAELILALDLELDEQRVSAFLEERVREPFERVHMNAPALERKVHGLSGEAAGRMAKLLRPDSDYFSVQAQGKVGDTVRSVWALLSRGTTGGGGASTRISITRVRAWRVQ